MNVNIHADAIDDLLTAVDAVSAGVTGDQLKLEMGREAQQIVKEHFEELANDEAHHKTAERLGAKRSGFYEEAAYRTQSPELESGGVSVSIDQEGLAQRLFGGPIEPKSAKFLTIPARAETYGHRAKEFDNLRLILFPSGAGALVAADSSGAKLRGSRSGSRISPIDKSGSDVFFWLVKEVSQEPDPTVLPSDEEILEPSLHAAERYVDLVWERLK